MEFYFPIKKGQFFHLIESLAQESLLSRYLQGVGQNSFWKSIGGFLKGLMDLVFRYKGKYYLLDWKSNRLNGHEDGLKHEIEVEMMDHHYILQYHIYWLGC